MAGSYGGRAYSPPSRGMIRISATSSPERVSGYTTNAPGTPPNQLAWASPTKMPGRCEPSGCSTQIGSPSRNVPITRSCGSRSWHVRAGLQIGLGGKRGDGEPERRGDVGGGAHGSWRADDRRNGDEDALDLLEGHAGVDRGADVHEVRGGRSVHGGERGEARGQQRVGVELAALERIRRHRGDRVEDRRLRRCGGHEVSFPRDGR